MTDSGADRESAGKPFFERSAFKAAVAVVGLLGGLWALLGAPKPWDAAKHLVEDPLPLRNVEIILDASSRMGAKFGETTKLDVAAEAVNQYVAPDEHVGLALRRAGGKCDEASDPVVGVNDEQTEKIAKAAAELEPEGRSNWALAVRGAIADFSAGEFHRPGSENQVVLFVGGGDQCGGLVAQEIHNELENANLRAQFRVFALGVPKKELKSLKSMKRQLRSVASVELHYANSVKQLYQAVQEETGEGGGGSARGPSSGGSQGPGPGANSEETEAGAEASQARGFSGPLSGAVEPEEEKVEPNEQEAKAEKEKEEEEETEAEAELELEEAEVAPVEEGGEGEAGGGLGESQPLPTPSESGKSPPRLSRYSFIPPMKPHGQVVQTNGRAAKNRPRFPGGSGAALGPLCGCDDLGARQRTSAGRGWSLGL